MSKRPEGCWKPLSSAPLRLVLQCDGRMMGQRLLLRAYEPREPSKDEGALHSIDRTMTSIVSAFWDGQRWEGWDYPFPPTHWAWDPGIEKLPHIPVYRKLDYVDAEVAILYALSENYDGFDYDYYCYNFSYLSRETGLDPKEVRRVIRLMAKKGLAKLTRGLMNEDGEVCGSGYHITKSGLDRLAQQKGNS